MDRPRIRILQIRSREAGGGRSSRPRDVESETPIEEGSLGRLSSFKGIFILILILGLVIRRFMYPAMKLEPKLKTP